MICDTSKERRQDSAPRDLRRKQTPPFRGGRRQGPAAGPLAPGAERVRMDEDRFNMSVRKFLKEVGVTSQRAIEKAVRDALEAGTLSAGRELDATMTLEIAAIGMKHVVTGRIEA